MKNKLVLVLAIGVIFSCQKAKIEKANESSVAFNAALEDQKNIFNFTEKEASQIEDIACKLKAYEKTGASEQEMDFYARQLMGEPITKAWSLDDFLGWVNDPYESTLLSQLNHQELNFYYENRVKTVFALKDAYMAIGLSAQNYNSGQHNGNWDAFRHCI